MAVRKEGKGLQFQTTTAKVPYESEEQMKTNNQRMEQPTLSLTADIIDVLAGVQHLKQM